MVHRTSTKATKLNPRFFSILIIISIIAFSTQLLNDQTLVQFTTGARVDYYDYSVNTTVTELVTDGTKEVIYVFTVINTGNQKDTYELSANLENITSCNEPDPEEWTYNLDKTIFALEPSYSQAVELLVTTGCKCQEGCVAVIVVTIESTSDKQHVEQLWFNTTRGKAQPPTGDPGLLVEINYNSESTKLKLDTDNILEVEITNTQNSNDDVYLIATNHPDDWEVTFSPDDFSISANSKKSIRMTLKIPAGTVANNYKVTVIAQSHNQPNINDMATIRIPVFGDVIIKNVKFSEDTLNVDEKVKITITIENIGLAALDNITLLFFDDINQTDSHESWLFSIGILEADTEKTVGHSWVPKREGYYNLYFQLDPDNRLTELQGGNNKRIEPVVVDEALDEDQVAPNFYYVSIFVLVLLVLWLIIFYRYKKIKTSVGINQDQPGKRDKDKMVDARTTKKQNRKNKDVKRHK